MAPDMESDSIPEVTDLHHSLRTTSLELNLARSKHSVEVVAKDEDIRKLRFQIQLLDDENDDLNEKLSEEEARSDGLETALDEALAQLEQLQSEKEALENDIRIKSRELSNVKAELKAMESVGTDSTKVLTEKLALSREVATLKPELQYLRTQVETNQGLLAEKLSLQRELTTLQVELENEKRTSARALARQGKNNEQDEELIAELESLRKDLGKQKRDRERAEKALQKSETALEKAQSDLESQDLLRQKESSAKADKALAAELETLQKDLAKQKRECERAEKALEKSELALEKSRSDHQSQKRATELALQKVERAYNNKEDDPQVDELRKELAQEKLDRQKQEKEFFKAQAQAEGHQAVLDEKLNAFRNKLKSTKDKLKETETEVQKLKAEAATRPIVEKPAKNPRKRMAASVDPDATIGTPGDGVPMKRTKRAATAAVGDKSTFSITPFLNRTASIAPDSPPQDEPTIEEDEKEEALEATPSAPPKKATKKAAQPKVKPIAKPLAPAASSKANAKPPARKKAPISTLEKVTEEVTEVAEENAEKPVSAPITTITENTENIMVPTFPVLKPASRPKAKPRKSLMSFAAFNEEPAPEKKKKRKLGSSGLGKTLFDAEEDDLPPKPIPGKGLFAARALGKTLLAGKGAKGPISGGFKMMTEDGFQFSPLKKDRRR
ncbi:hypothetical protein BU16DRAFT_581914 [Lophium mytilinum]|uniref:Uncharacterized protein n=1 Tax=Lophium mytilinum TaxID=390894 RepID=A0A6A6QRN0_9PEZI|nr:hypothetical protein BU16DRAFT_581914 [Lophium mytilinum]